MKKFIALIMILALLVTTGCTQEDPQTLVNNDDSTAEVKADENNGEIADGVEVITLKIAHNYDFTTIPEGIIEAGNRLNEKYAEDGKNIRVEFERDYFTIDWGEYINNIIFAHKSGDAPDIFSTTNEDALIDAGVVLDISDLKTDAFVEGTWTPFMRDGKAYAYPMSLPLRVIYYNKNKLVDIGWTKDEIDALPAKIEKGVFTLEDFINVSKELVDAGVCDYGLAHRPNAGHDFDDIIQALGGRYYDEEGSLVFNELDILRTFEFFYDNANVLRITPQDSSQLGWGEINRLVGSGECFAYFGPIFATNYIAGAVDWTVDELAENMDFVLYPASGTDGKPFAISAPEGVAISADTEYPDICMDILRELSVGSADQLAEHAASTLSLSSVQAANTEEVILESQILSSILYMQDYAVSLPIIEGKAFFDSELFKQIELLELGQTTPEKAVKNMKTQLSINVDNVIYE